MADNISVEYLDRELEDIHSSINNLLYDPLKIDKKQSKEIDDCFKLEKLSTADFCRFMHYSSVSTNPEKSLKQQIYC